MPIQYTGRLCSDGLVAALVGSTVREQVVDDHADDGEEEDHETPEDLVKGGAVRLEDFHCWWVSSVVAGTGNDCSGLALCYETHMPWGICARETY